MTKKFHPADTYAYWNFSDKEVSHLRELWDKVETGLTSQERFDFCEMIREAGWGDGSDSCDENF
jgi:hypothetical protein